MIRRLGVAIRALMVLTVVAGGLYPLVVLGVAQLFFRHQADGSPLAKGSRLIAQDFAGHPRYFQSRPSATGYDVLRTGASNLGPESVVDVPGRPSLLTQVCARSKRVGEREGVSGARPFCTGSGVGAVLKVFPGRVVSVNEPCPAVPFMTEYQGVNVECAQKGQSYAAGRTVPIRGGARWTVPPDAVTASGSGLDPHISVRYADLQAARVARERGRPVEEVRALVRRHTDVPAIGFMGEPGVNVLALNLDLDR
uniref:potassium-transporting ATPase subunit C n=1 Tax=Herbidospora sakaeratensis TaxID=564415 RepID=UPI000A7E2FBF|nr:potassium-transporting ATPase subunit C [Herbidospora sakaeratensis]